MALAYALVAWLLIQVAETTFEPLRLPEWSVTLVVMMAILGFPLALVLAWVFEVTPRGVRFDTGPESPDQVSNGREASGTKSGAASGDAAPVGPVPEADADTEEAAGDASVAVLPFADLSPEGDQEYFCRGLAEEISSALAAIPRLRVASRMSASQFRNEGADVAEIGRRLHVATVVEGTVRKAGEQLRVTAQLVNARDGFQIWGERYDAELSDVFAVQDRIAGSIAEAFELSKDPASQARARLQGTGDVEAYDFYLRGMSFMDRTSGRNFGFARDMFRKALDRDPEFTRAWAGLAIAGFMHHVWGNDSSELVDEVDTASRRALALCGESALAHLARGLAMTLMERLDEAADHLEQATRLEPGLFEAWYYSGRVAMQRGDTSEAIRLMERAAAVRPTDYQSAMLLPQLYAQLGDDPQARRWSREGLDRARRHLDLQPDDYRAMYLSAGALLNLGDPEAGRELMERAMTLGGDESGVLYNAACFYARSGDPERALDCLERSPLVGRLPVREWMENDHDLVSLRGHPRFNALLDRAGPDRGSDDASDGSA